MKFVGFDTETVIKDHVHQFFSFQVYSDDFPNCKFVSYEPNDLLFMFTKRFDRAIFVVFNLNFDGIVVSRILKDKGEGNFEVTVVDASNRPIRMTVRKGGMKFTFVDIDNVMNTTSLASLGKIVQVQKLEKPSWLGKRGWVNEEEKRQFEEYALKDAEICYKSAKMVYDEFGVFRATCGALAMTIFKRDFCHVKKFPEYYPEVNEKLRLSYRGGRCEALKRGTNSEKIYYYDVNSMYPFVMVQNDFPYVFNRYTHKNSINLDNEGVAHAVVKVEHDFPPLGVKRTASDGFEKLMFAEGVINDWFTYPELRAVEGAGVGRTVKVIEAFEWSSTFNPFREYIKTFYQKKNEATQSESPKRQLYKIMLNSLYGKFGEYKAPRLLTFDGAEIKERKELPSRHKWYHSVVVAAYITSYARLHLWNLILKAGSDKVYYMDTDSLYTSKPLPSLVGGELGQLKLKGEANPSFAIFVRSKFYVFNDEIKVKGFGFKEDPETFKMRFWKNDFKSFEHRILKIKEASRRGLFPLTDVYIEKRFDCSPDHKREYERLLEPKELIYMTVGSQPVTVEERV